MFTVLILVRDRALTLFSVLTAFCFQAQTGPAGVQSSLTNVFWVKSDAGTSSTVNATAISSWNDQSGNGINVAQATANQQPSFATNVINGYPAIQFDNVSTTNDKLTAADNSLLDNTSGYTFFMVTRPQTLDGNARAIISKRTTVGVDQSFMHFYYSTNKLYTDIQTTNDRYNTAAAFSANTNYLHTQQFDGTLAAGSRCRTYVSGSLNITASETSTSVPDNNSPLVIGSTDASDGRPFGGYIAEIIIYRTTLSTAERIIVENYLSAKYNIALLSNDNYVGDNSGNGDYDQEVAGIGKESGTANNSFSASACAGLGCSVNSGLDNGDYLFAGNKVNSNSILTSDVAGMSGSNNSRWERVWYVDVTNSSTNLNLNLNFDFSDAGLIVPAFGYVSDYVLLYRSTEGGTWTELSAASAISGDVVIFNNITLTTDGYYTLGTKNYFASPLPIELLTFEALPDILNARVKWKTASEHQSLRYILERSRDAENYDTVAILPAAGESNEIKNYEFLDQLQTSGNIYYRLTEQDFAGRKKTFPLISAEVLPALEWRIYPNPTENIIYFERGQNTLGISTYSIVDLTGAIRASGEIASNSRLLALDLKALMLPSGIYLVQLLTGTERSISKIILK